MLSYGDWLVLRSTVLMGLPMLMSSFFKIPKQVCKRLDLDCDFFGRVMVIRGNIDSPVGILFVGQKTKGV
jgi:hypothetical protein